MLSAHSARASLGFAAVLLATLSPAQAAPYLPTNDTVVLETLPSKAADPAAVELEP